MKIRFYFLVSHFKWKMRPGPENEARTKRNSRDTSPKNCVATQKNARIF